MYEAIVIGSTGAIGRQVVKELLNSPDCQKVIALTRRPDVQFQPNSAKLQIRQVNYDQLKTADFAGESDKIGVFCCLGTTKAEAGSAEAFRKIDYELVKNAASLCKQSQVPYFGLVSASNANQNSWFLYPKTKGETEQAIKDLDFPRTSIFRPGLLNRGQVSRTIEKIGLYLLPSIPVESVAKAMVFDFEQGADGKSLHEVSHDEMKSIAAKK